MGRPPTGDRIYTVQHIWNVHHEVVRLAIMGFKQVDIATQLNVSEAMVSYTLNSPIVKRQLDIMRAARDINSIDVARQIRDLAPVAVEKMKQLMESNTDMVSLRASQDILDRAGFGAIKKEVSLSGQLTKEDIEDIKNRAKEVGLCTQDAIDAEYSPIQ